MARPWRPDRARLALRSLRHDLALEALPALPVRVMRLFPTGRVLTLHMLRTGGWCAGDPIAMRDFDAVRVLRRLAREGLVDLDAREVCGVFTPKGLAWAEDYWRERAVRQES